MRARVRAVREPLRLHAKRGYSVIAPNSEAGLLPSHSAFANDLDAAIAWGHATQPNAHPTPAAVLGHSMGGGTAVLAAAADPSMSTVATRAAADTNPSAVTAATSLTVSALFVLGSADSVVTPSSSRAIYGRTPTRHRGVGDRRPPLRVPRLVLVLRAGLRQGIDLALAANRPIERHARRLAGRHPEVGAAFSRPAGTTGEQK